LELDSSGHEMKKYSIILAVGIIIGLGIYHFLFVLPKGYVDVKPPITHPTIITNPNGAKDDSPIQMSGEMIDNNTMLRVNAWDDEKKTYADFPITCTPVIRHHIIQANYYFQYHKGEFFQSYGAAYLYSWGRAAIGGGAIGSNQNIGIQVVGQINF
jgi:hypothetical protein